MPRIDFSGGIAGGHPVANISSSMGGFNSQARPTGVQSAGQSVSNRGSGSGGLWRSGGSGVNYSSLRNNDVEYTSEPPSSPSFQPIKSSEINAQMEFLQVELDRLSRIKDNILRISKKYSRYPEKQTTLRAKLAVLLLEENYLASLYTNLTNTYGQTSSV